MIKRINESFTLEEHRKLSAKKEELRKELKLSRISWHDYIINISGIRK